MRIVKRQDRLQERARRMTSAAGLFVAGAATARLASYLDKRRRHIARDRAAAATRDIARTASRKARYTAGIVKGAFYEPLTPLRREQREYEDVTLARKVESELLRPADAPKDSVSINVHNGIVELRGQVRRPADIKQLADATRTIEGVKDVHNLLHTAGSPPKHSPAGQSHDNRRARCLHQPFKPCAPRSQQTGRRDPAASPPGTRSEPAARPRPRTTVPAPDPAPLPPDLDPMPI